MRECSAEQRGALWWLSGGRGGVQCGLPPSALRERGVHRRAQNTDGSCSVAGPRENTEIHCPSRTRGAEDGTGGLQKPDYFKSEGGDAENKSRRTDSYMSSTCLHLREHRKGYCLYTHMHISCTYSNVCEYTVALSSVSLPSGLS